MFIRHLPCGIERYLQTLGEAVATAVPVLSERSRYSRSDMAVGPEQTDLSSGHRRN